jgi:hypothetical protein
MYRERFFDILMMNHWYETRRSRIEKFSIAKKSMANSFELFIGCSESIFEVESIHFLFLPVIILTLGD